MVYWTYVVICNHVQTRTILRVRLGPHRFSLTCLFVARVFSPHLLSHLSPCFFVFVWHSSTSLISLSLPRLYIYIYNKFNAANQEPPLFDLFFPLLFLTPPTLNYFSPSPSPSPSSLMEALHLPSEIHPHFLASAVKDRKPDFQELPEPDIHIVTSAGLRIPAHSTILVLPSPFFFSFSFLKSRLNWNFNKSRL